MSTVLTFLFGCVVGVGGTVILATINGLAKENEKLKTMIKEKDE